MENLNGFTRNANIVNRNLNAATVTDLRYVRIVNRNLNAATVTDLVYVHIINGNINAGIAADPKFVIMEIKNLNVANAEMDRKYVKRPYVALAEIENTTNTVLDVTYSCFQMIRLYEITRQKNSL